MPCPAVPIDRNRRGRDHRNNTVPAMDRPRSMGGWETVCSASRTAPRPMMTAGRALRPNRRLTRGSKSPHEKIASPMTPTRIELTSLTCVR